MTQVRIERGRWAVVWIAVAGALLLIAPSRAAAQDNSLFRRAPQPAPTARQVPTSQPAVSVISGTAGSARATLQKTPPTNARNVVLLHASPIAVEMPEPEQIAVHDLITIIVRVSKSAKTDSKMESTKDWSHEWGLDEWIRLSDKHGIVPAKLSQGAPSVKFDLKNDYSGDGKYDRSDSLTTRIQAEVIDVKPNGNVVLEATNQVRYGEEDFTITLTGTCRSADVTPENTVLSSQIANLVVNVDDRGAMEDATRRGWLMRTFDLLRPF